MTKFQHKTQPITIGYSEYINLTEMQKLDFYIVNGTPSQTTNNITNNKDLLGLGEVAGVVVAVPLVIVGSIFGLFD